MFWLIVSFVLLFPPRVDAVDLSISNPICVEDLISLTASLSATNNYYLLGGLRSVGTTRYFGETQGVNNDTWISYATENSLDYITTNYYLTSVQDSQWQGTLRLRYSVTDPLYQGPGTYEIRLFRYTGKSLDAAGSSNIITVDLTLPTPTPSSSPEINIIVSPTPSPSSLKESASPIPSVSATAVANSPHSSIMSSPVVTVLDFPDVNPSQIASYSTAAAILGVSSQNNSIIWIWLGAGLTLITLTLLLVYRFMTHI